MDKNLAETLIKVYAIIFWVEAALAMIGAAFILMRSTLVAHFLPIMNVEKISNMVLGSLFFIIALLIIDFFVGFGLWRRRPWARIAALVLCVLSIFNVPIGMVIGGFGIYLFGFEEEMKKLFK